MSEICNHEWDYSLFNSYCTKCGEKCDHKPLGDKLNKTGICPVCKAELIGEETNPFGWSCIRQTVEKEDNSLMVMAENIKEIVKQERQTNG